MADPYQNVRDWISKLAPGAAVPEEKVAELSQTSDYYMQTYLKSLPEYANSLEYKEKMADFQDLHQRIFGYQSPDIAGLDSFIRYNLSQSQVLAGWRKLPEYSAMFAGKPGYMSEDQYRTAYNDMLTGQEGVRKAFGLYSARKDLTQDDINKIFFGGPGSDEIRREYARVKAVKDSTDAVRGNLASTTVKATPLGPTTPMLAGYEVSSPTEPYVVPKDQQQNPDNSWGFYNRYRNQTTS